MQTNNINFIQQWHLTTGCTKISDGCRNCSVEQKMRSHLPGKSFFDVNCYPERLDELCRKRKAATYFVCSMGDLFHSEVPDRFIYEAWRYMAACKKHTFIVITKRPERAMGLLAKCKGWKGLITHNGAPEEYVYAGGGIFVGHEDNWPPKNIWLGVSIENQARADECIRYLLRTPAAVRFLDIEPMLRFIDVRQASWGKGLSTPTS